MKATNQLVMLKVLMVEEGIREMIVEKKWRTLGGKEGAPNSARSQTFEGKHASLMKNVAYTETSPLTLKSDAHMVLPYIPYAKHIHPRCSRDRMAIFLVEGSTLSYLPSPQEFFLAEGKDVDYDQDARHQLFFKLSEAQSTSAQEEPFETRASPSYGAPSALAMSSEEAQMTNEGGSASPTITTRRMSKEKNVATTSQPSNDLWFCTSLQSTKARRLLRCENVQTGVTEDIPVEQLGYALRKCDDLAIAPYEGMVMAVDEEVLEKNQGKGKGKPVAVPTGPGKQKAAQKKHGKADATLDTDHIQPSSYLVSGKGTR